MSLIDRQDLYITVVTLCSGMRCIELLAVLALVAPDAPWGQVKLGLEHNVNRLHCIFA